MTAPTPEAVAISRRCPSSPKPVMSVAALTPIRAIGPTACGVEGGHDRDRFRGQFGRAHLALQGRRDDSDAQRLGEDETVAGAGAGIGDDTSRATSPVTANPYLGSESSIECPPTIVVPLISMTSAPPRRTSPSSRKCEPGSGPADQLQGRDGGPAHGIYIREGVGGCDPAPVVGVVDDRGEEVDRLDQGFPGGRAPTPRRRRRFGARRAGSETR